MGRRASYFDINQPRVIKFLEQEDLAYEQFNGGTHLRIYGQVNKIDLWPSRMKYHIIATEGVLPAYTYQALDPLHWEDEDLDKILNEYF